MNRGSKTITSFKNRLFFPPKGKYSGFLQNVTIDILLINQEEVDINKQIENLAPENFLLFGYSKRIGRGKNT